MNPTTKPDPLGDKLRSEGLADTPAFSPQLHARILTRLHEQGLDADDADQSLLPPRWHIGLRVAGVFATAACVAIAAFFIFHTPTETAPLIANRDRPRDPWLPSIQPSAFVAPVQEAIGAPTSTALQRGRFGYVDQDAQRLAIFVASQLPTFDDAPTTAPQ